MVKFNIYGQPIFRVSRKKTFRIGTAFEIKTEECSHVRVWIACRYFVSVYSSSVDFLIFCSPALDISTQHLILICFSYLIFWTDCPYVFAYVFHLTSS